MYNGVYQYISNAEKQTAMHPVFNKIVVYVLL